MAVCLRRQPRDDPARQGSRRRARTPLSDRLRPLTDRVFASLPGPRALWIAVWAVLPWLNAGANLLLDPDARSAVWDQSRVLVVLNYAALSFAIVVALLGTTRIARRLETLPQAVAGVLEVDGGLRSRAADSAAGPLVASAAGALAFGLGALVDDGLAAGLLRGTTWLLLGIPLWTFLWTYGALQLGLDRLGRRRLLPTVSPVDPTLGLRPLGAAAFLGLWLLLAWLVPLVLTGLPDVLGVAIGAAVLVAALAAFVLSLHRLHRQMAAFKKNELAIARELYAEAYEPVRAAPTVETLERQQRRLSAADVVEKRAHAIHEWPLDDGMVARVVTIATSVVAITVARLILEPLGL